MRKKKKFIWLLIMFCVIGYILYVPRKEQQEEQIIETMPPELVKEDREYLEESPDIRVILQAGNYDGLYHSEVEVMFPDGGYVLVGEKDHWVRTVIKAGKSVRIGIGDKFDFPIQKDKLIALVPAQEHSPLVVRSIERSRTECSYYGRLEVSLEDAGLMLINNVGLETYLESVVPSEMPASYEQEALEAQAILARTYAYKYLIHPGYSQFGANVDDSVAFQVYGNIDRNEATTEAVQKTAGILLFHEQNLADVYYYSTSCGYGTDGTVWGSDGAEYLQAKRIGGGVLQTKDGTAIGEKAEQYYLELLQDEAYFRAMIHHPFVDGYEAEDSWYRWSAVDVTIDTQAILSRLQERYIANKNVILTQNKKGEFVSQPVKKLGNIHSIKVDERGVGGICKSIIIEGSEAVYKVLLEYNIRYVLNGSGTTVQKSDGSSSYCRTLLPSGFFYLDTVQDGKNVISYSIYGGGYGHGVGMSQNGANRMAKAGFSCENILQMFFPETIFVSYENNN